MPKLKEETIARLRAELEAAALECFIRKGYAATTTREIAREVGLTAGALYSHYALKEALFSAVVEGYRERLTSEAGDLENPVRRVLDQTRFPHDIADLAIAIKEVVQTHRAYWKLWYVDVIEFDGKHFSSALAPAALLENEALKRRFAQLKRERALRVEPGLAFVMTYMHLFNYFLVETLFGANHHYGVPEEQAIEAVSSVFLHGMLAREATA